MDNMKTDSYDDISQMIEKHAGDTQPSMKKMKEAMDSMASEIDEQLSGGSRNKRCHELPAYTLDVIRDGSDKYIEALKKAILAITKGEYGYIDYKGYKIYYTDTPQIESISLEDGHKEYCYWIRFLCDAINIFCTEEYHSEEERMAFLDPENALFEKTVALLDEEIKYLDEGTWIKKRKKLKIYDFKDYSSEGLIFKKIDWDERNKSASNTFSYLMADAIMRAKGIEYTEEDFTVFSEVIRRMVFFADYGKKNYLFELEGLIRFEWEPKTEQDKYIKQCMDEFGQGDLPDHLLDNCSLYYFLEDPKGWKALAYILPIYALWEMCNNYEPDNVKDGLLKVFDLIPTGGYRERLEKLIEEDRAKAGKEGGGEDDQENI